MLQKILITTFILWVSPYILTAADEIDEIYTATEEEQEIYNARMGLYLKIAAVTDLDWYTLAAIDQYERNINDLEDDQVIGIQIEPDLWFGLLSFDAEQDHLEETINLLGGIGKDGDGDGIADPLNDEDVLYTFAVHLQQLIDEHGDFDQAIETYYDREKVVMLVKQYEKIFKELKRLDLSERSFIVPKHFNYSYRSTWGHSRGFGGRRIHEGTDLFAGYGTPVKSASYGIVEIMGWNKYGGWRVGIRDIYNIYHYYAHLGSFAEDLEEGSIVTPGEIIGYVGSTGYGPEGTAGKFPPHLHYGMYLDNGRHEWAFDPYPHLRLWERNSDS